ncbi:MULTISPECIES: hypothetical protein [unclassified Pseudoclavibacter]|uniref:hypothetical protein n=1 Tax=unclassified Pseudoclavibacter TaxID=2615177 RepID=UPI001301900B|nr:MULTISPECIES: hypothetical protein [unclassified Pseudoclavibacter]KAB1644502.1 hypothetical protein F8O06_10735 [Pseudoclavibacter sp. CFCC 14310]KAB1663994.1 hypothetical protein F8O08_00785 [Pseudoclavibacter sp. CFCC 13611]
MQIQEFARAYQTPYRVPQRRGSEIDTIMLPARTFSGAWGEVLCQSLDGQPEGALRARVKTLQTAYQGWFETVGDVLMRQLSHTLEASDAEVMTALAEMAFHRMNTHLGAAWLRLARSAESRGARRQSGEGVADATASARIAIRADIDRLSGAHRGIETSGEFAADDVAELDDWYSALVTQMRAFDDLLEVAQIDPDVVVLPAPVQFSTQGAASCDVVLVNPATDRAIGVRVPHRSGWRSSLRSSAGMPRAGRVAADRSADPGKEAAETSPSGVGQRIDHARVLEMGTLRPAQIVTIALHQLRPVEAQA